MNGTVPHLPETAEPPDQHGPGVGHSVRWRPAALAHGLATVALIAVLTALPTGRASLLLLAAPTLAVLAAARARPRPTVLRIEASVSARRCFEGEHVELTVTVTTPRPLDAINLELATPDTFEIMSGDARQCAAATTGTTARWTLRPGRWGRHDIAPVHLDLRAGHRLWQARLRITAGEISVFPRGPRVRPRLIPRELLRRIGEHVSRTAGSGVEFAGIRPYLPGDRLRDINRKATTHRGRLHVTTRAAERQADLVIVIDATTDLGPPGDSTLDRAMRGAAALTTAYLRHGDRVGAVALGGHPRWLAPGIGDRHFYRIAEAVLDVRRYPTELPADLTRIPRPALPPAALAIVFTPLLDDAAITAIHDLHRRGNPTLVIDVLDREPYPGRRSAVAATLALRLWRLDRAALHRTLTEHGIPVIGWHRDRTQPDPRPEAGAGTLDAVLAAAPRPPTARRPA
jgi:uncharacterized protein (DUF58 family)